MVSNQNNNNTSLLFEYPLQENIRSFLRLESLFNQFERNKLASHADNHLHALKFLFEILEILERGDTRSELIKELARIQETYALLVKNPQVDTSKLDNFLNQVNQLHAWVLQYSGKFGEKVRKDPFIESVKHRSSIPGGACPFDCPELFLFLNQESKIRQEQLSAWLENINGVKTSIEVVLRLIRESGNWRQESAPLGSFMIETPDKPFRLLRIQLDQATQIFPEFSCGRHRSNIHFMIFNNDKRKVPVRKPVEFSLACCQ